MNAAAFRDAMEPPPPVAAALLPRPMVLVTRDTPHGPFAVHLPVADFHRPDYTRGMLRGSELAALHDYVTPGERLELRRAKVVRFTDGSFVIRITTNQGKPLTPYVGKPYLRPIEPEED